MREPLRHGLHLIRIESDRTHLKAIAKFKQGLLDRLLEKASTPTTSWTPRRC
jgi:hypothetical protein